MNILVYTKEGCPNCDTAKQLLNSNDVAYQEVVVGKDMTREAVLAKFPHAVRVPIIVVNDRHELGGPDELKLLLEKDELKFLEAV